MKYTAALAGNPNSGKTTLFNLLTGSNQYVGNWAGVTVEMKKGSFWLGEHEIELVDLPGIYSLSPYSMEEVISRDYLCDKRPDMIINIVDGTNLERNLYLTLQLTELGIPTMLAVNMTDELQAQGTQVDYSALGDALGVGIAPISAKKEMGIDQLKNELTKGLQQKRPPRRCSYNASTTVALKQILSLLDLPKTAVSPDYYASKILENDPNLYKKLRLCAQVKQKTDAIRAGYEQQGGHDAQTLLADARYRYIEQLIRRYVVKKPPKHSITDRIDRVVIHKYLAIPIFLLIMLLIFVVTFGPLGNLLKDASTAFINNTFSPFITNALSAASAPDWCVSLFVDGIISGVGAVLAFLPQIMLLFLFLTLLEDSGYMARAAFVMDGFLRRIGLNGKAFIPMLMGFGCTVPAVMAARTMENKNEKRLTIMLVPFMSCAARMPVYALFAGALFPRHQGLVVFGLYILGIVVAILTGLLLKKTIFKKNDAPFLLELPPYRLPAAKTLLRHLWDRCRDFIVRAGTLIFSMSVIVWVLQSFTPDLVRTTSSQESILGHLGTLLAPVFLPLGFGTWQAAVSLLSGVVAKEAVLSSLMVIYGMGTQEALSAFLPSVFTPLSALSFMVFVLLYVPCIAAFGTIKREMGSWRWALGSMLMQTLVAYTISLLVYQLGSLLF